MPDTPLDYYSQRRWRVRCEWGAEGMEAIAGDADVVVIVDVLSFSTCVEVAVSRGAVVYPSLWKDERASALAKEVGATLAVGRGEAGPSLSPASLLALEPGSRIVLPSPNGSTLTTLAPGGATVIAGCLRNAGAVANAVERIGGTVALIAAGERWPQNGMLRPALEDLIGAGAIIDRLSAPRSPEAEHAAAAYRAVRSTLAERVKACSSGQELIVRGFERDVEIAASLDAGSAVPVFRNGAYHP